MRLSLFERRSGEREGGAVDKGQPSEGNWNVPDLIVSEMLFFCR